MKKIFKFLLILVFILDVAFNPIICAKIDVEHRQNNCLDLDKKEEGKISKIKRVLSENKGKIVRAIVALLLVAGTGTLIYKYKKRQWPFKEDKVESDEESDSEEEVSESESESDGEISDEGDSESDEESEIDESEIPPLEPIPTSELPEHTNPTEEQKPISNETPKQKVEVEEPRPMGPDLLYKEPISLSTPQPEPSLEKSHEQPEIMPMKQKLSPKLVEKAEKLGIGKNVLDVAVESFLPMKIGKKVPSGIQPHSDLIDLNNVEEKDKKAAAIKNAEKWFYAHRGIGNFTLSQSEGYIHQYPKYFGALDADALFNIIKHQAEINKKYSELKKQFKDKYIYNLSDLITDKYKESLKDKIKAIYPSESVEEALKDNAKYQLKEFGRYIFGKLTPEQIKELEREKEYEYLDAVNFLETN